jgi:hypothetical protein
MPLTLNKVQEYERVPGTALDVRLVRTNHYIRICAGGGPPVYVQGGRCYGEGGPEIDVLPDWFAGEMAKVSAKARTEVGWQDVAVEAPAQAPVVRAVPSPKQWTCPDCDTTMIAKKRGFHAAWHRRQERAAVELAGSV